MQWPLKQQRLSGRSARRGTRGTLQREQVFWAYVFLLPWIIGLVVFIVGPILFSLGLSFFNYTLGREATFIGLDNWIKAFTQDELFWPSIGRTFLYTAFVVAAECLRRVDDGDAAQSETARHDLLPHRLFHAAPHARRGGDLYLAVAAQSTVRPAQRDHLADRCATSPVLASRGQVGSAIRASLCPR